MSASPALSLIVCTRDRADRLAATLEAIAAMRPRRSWELVVVDNGSRDDTPRLLAGFTRAAPFPVTRVREERPGLASARNTGITASRSPLIVFTDDDCYPAVDFVDRWCEVFADPAVGYGAGRILLHDPDDFPLTIRTDTEPRPIPPGGFVEPGLVQGANMAIRRDVVLALGGFDPALGPGGVFNCEDLDISSRASLAGYAGGYFPGPVVYHHHRRRLAHEIAALRRSYARGRGAYFASLVMRGAARRPIARHLREALRWKSPVEVACELAAALHYVTYRLVRPAERPLAPHAGRGR